MIIITGLQHSFTTQDEGAKMEIPAEIMEKIEGEIKKYFLLPPIIEEEQSFRDGAIFGYNLSREELEEKDKEIAKANSEIERLERILNMQQKSGTIEPPVVAPNWVDEWNKSGSDKYPI